MTCSYKPNKIRARLENTNFPSLSFLLKDKVKGEATYLIVMILVLVTIFLVLRLYFYFTLLQIPVVSDKKTKPEETTLEKMANNTIVKSMMRQAGNTIVRSLRDHLGWEEGVERVLKVGLNWGGEKQTK